MGRRVHDGHSSDLPPDSADQEARQAQRTEREQAGHGLDPPRLERVGQGWEIRGGAPLARSGPPQTSQGLLGRAAELARLALAMQGVGARVAVHGAAGVGKSSLVEQFCAQHQERLGVICRWVLDPGRPATAAQGLYELAWQAGLAADDIPPRYLAATLNAQKISLHIDNVDSPAVAGTVVELLRSMPALPAIVTGRYPALEITPDAGWHRVEVERLDVETSREVLRVELGRLAPTEAQLRALADELEGLPLALQLVAGCLRGGGTSVESFLPQLRNSIPRASSPQQRHPLVAAVLELGKKRLFAEAAGRGAAWDHALHALGWAPSSGFGLSLGAAVARLPSSEMGQFLDAATSLSLVHRAPGAARPDAAWSMPSSLAELLRVGHPKAQADAHMAAWVTEHGRDAVSARIERWPVLARERTAVHAWLAALDAQSLAPVLAQCWAYGASHGPTRPWLDVARCCGRLPHPGATAARAWAQLARRVGELKEASQAAELLVAECKGDLERAEAKGLVVELLVARGEAEEALRTLREEMLPLLERVGGRELVTGLTTTATYLIQRGGTPELREARRYLMRASSMSKQLGMRLPKSLLEWLASGAGLDNA